MAPPAHLTWSLDGTERELHFEYGYVPEAFERGTPNGAEFIVELTRAGSTRMGFRRYLDPLKNKDDRRQQFSRVILPLFLPGTQLILRTTPGQYNDNAWDWLFVNSIGFPRSRQFLTAQFPTFNRAPNEADAESAYLDQDQGRANAIELHAPCKLVYYLDGNEPRLTFNYGFRSGAYENGGNTDGANFIVELQEANLPVKPLLKRLLLPGSEPNDRGEQSATISLGAFKAKSRLVVIIDPGPAGNNSWDWTYITPT